MAAMQGSPFGKAWEYTLFFYDENNSSTPRKIKQDDLKNLKRSLKDGKITKIFADKNPLTEIITDSDLFYHMFLVIKTDELWWSIEKVTQGLILQCKSQEGDVRNKRAGKDRNPGPIEEIKNDKGKHSIGELIDWLHDKEELNRVYNVLTDNCQHFGTRVYEFVTGIDESRLFKTACAKK